jgi:hypothetical protein
MKIYIDLLVAGKQPKHSLSLSLLFVGLGFELRTLHLQSGALLLELHLQCILLSYFGDGVS